MLSRLHRIGAVGWRAVLVASLAAAPPAAHARINRFVGHTYSVQPGEVVSGQVWALASTVTVQGTVSDDLLAAGNEILLGGRVGGDLWAGGHGCSVTGEIAGDAFIAVLGPVLVAAPVHGNLIAGSAQAFELSRDALVGGDAAIAASTIVLAGEVRGRAFLVGNKVTISGRVADKLRLIADDVVFLPGAYIGGDVLYTSTEDRELVVPDQVTIWGEIRKVPPPMEGPGEPGAGIASRLLNQLFYLGAALLVGLLWVGMFPATADSSVVAWQGSLLKSLAVGLGVLVLGPVFLGGLIFSVIGFPLGLAASAFYVVLLVLSKPVVGYGLGRLMLWRGRSYTFGYRLASVGVGLLVLYGTAMIPGLGVAIWTFATATGMGALILCLVRAQRAYKLVEVRQSMPTSTTEA